MDIETYAEIFTYSAINIDTEEVVKYVICSLRDDREELIAHLRSCKAQISFNGIGFDYPILHYFMQDYKNLQAEDMCKKAQEIIDDQNKTSFGFEKWKHQIKEKEWLIPQLDLYKLWHYNNRARATSLKALEISMNYPNVLEMKRSDEEFSLKTIDQVLEYNLNDVLATFEFYKKSFHKILLRKQIEREYGLKCRNYPDVKIGEELILKLYCDQTFNPSIKEQVIDLFERNRRKYEYYWDVKKMRTKRSSIKLNECILPIIKFQHKDLQKLLAGLKALEITKTKDSVKKSVPFHDILLEFGTGGIHACTKAGIYESTDIHVIKSCDVASLYPSLAIIYSFYPEHLGLDFCKVYKDILEKRIEAKKAGDINMSDAFKLSLNGAYGKSSDEFSFLYDPKFTMQITLGGQLLLTMLVEALSIMIPEIKFLLINTDGLEVIIPRNKENIYYRVCETWEKLTQLSLEYVDYQKLVLRDVNNYIALTVDNKKKYKGSFEIDKVVGNEPAYHKDNSFRIIPIALSNYFLDGIPVEETILNYKDVYDFCGRQKFKGKDYGETHTIKYDETDNPYVYIDRQQKHVRYYISTDGISFIKKYAKGTTEIIHGGWLVTIFNKFEEKGDYSIDYDFYIQECLKEIENIKDKQLKLF